MNSCLCAGGYSSGKEQLTSSFDVSSEIGTVGLSMYILGFAVGPLMLAPLSEYFGRNPIYMLSWFLLVIFQIPLALAPNVATVIACRLLQGFFGSAPLTVSRHYSLPPPASKSCDAISVTDSHCRTLAERSATCGRETNVARLWPCTASQAPGGHRLLWSSAVTSQRTRGGDGCSGSTWLSLVASGSCSSSLFQRPATLSFLTRRPNVSASSCSPKASLPPKPYVTLILTRRRGWPHYSRSHSLAHSGSYSLSREYFQV